MIKKENAEIKQKKSLGDYIIKKYLGLIDWAASNPAAKKKIAEPKEPAILLKALDGLVKHLNGGHLEDESEQNSGLSGILGLSKEKI